MMSRDDCNQMPRAKWCNLCHWVGVDPRLDFPPILPFPFEYAALVVVIEQYTLDVPILTLGTGLDTLPSLKRFLRNLYLTLGLSAAKRK